MRSKAYIFIDATEGKVDEALMTLREKPGITLVDYVEGPPDIIMLAEAEECQKLAELTIRALTSVEHLTSSIQCLPVIDGGIEYASVENKGEGGEL